MPANPSPIVLSDSDEEVSQPSRNRRRQEAQACPAYIPSSGSFRGPANGWVPGRRRSEDSPAAGSSRAAQHATGGGRTLQQATGGSREAVVDLTKYPDEEVLVVSSTSPRKRARTAKKAKPVQPSFAELTPETTTSGAKCGICYEKMDGNMACGPCGHVFCDKCLRAAVKAQKKCPTCRKNLQPKQIHRVFISM